MLGNDIKITQLVGVGDVELHFQPDQRVYCLIGENGVGKTRTLEALFTLYFFSLSQLSRNDTKVYMDRMPFKKVTVDKFKSSYFSSKIDLAKNIHFHFSFGNYEQPVVYINALSRAKFDKDKTINKEIGDFNQRRCDYFNSFFNSINSKETYSIGKSNDDKVNEWIIQRAQSANKYQTKEDNREVEITTLLKLLNQVDGRINDSFLQISGDNSVYIQIEDKKTELSELSSGFASLLKIIQSIIAGYSYFTNETDIANVEGLVFIDEIESHLHSKWQANIINILKSIFPNTTFYITTHSAIVISQLQDGEVYEMYRDEADKVVKTKQIQHPNKVALVDLLKNAFDVDINQLKLDRNTASSQGEAKQALLDLLDSRIDELEQLEND